MRARNAVAAALVAAAIGAGAATAAAEPAYLPYYVVMDPPIVYPGAVVRLEVRAPSDADSGSVLVVGRRFQGEIKDGIFSAYFAVDIDTLPGPYVLSYDVGSRHGTRTVTVRARRFDDSKRVAVPISPADEALEDLVNRSPTLVSLWNRVTLERYWSDSFLTPVSGEVGSPFGVRKTTTDSSAAKPLTSVALVATSAASVVASSRGVVALVADAPGGIVIVIDHGLGVYTYYAGLARAVVAEGKTVARGAEIGKLPAAARPVLRFGARLGGADVDPVTLPGIQLRIPDLLPEARRQPSEERYRAHDYDY